jgi:uncharacterized RDD family membrane protein YckC
MDRKLMKKSLLNGLLVSILMLFGVAVTEAATATVEGVWVRPAGSGLFVVTQQTGADKSSVAKVGYRQKKKPWVWNERLGNVTSTASAGEELYLLFDDGTMVREGDSYVLPELPAGVRADSLAGEAGGRRLFVLAERDGFSLTPASQPATESAEKSDGLKKSRWAVYELDSGEWRAMGELPCEWGVTTRPTLLADADGLAAICRTDSFSQAADYLRYEGDRWVEAGSVELPAGVSEVRGVVFDRKSWLIMATSVEGGKSLGLYRLEEAGLTEVGVLKSDDKPMVVAGGFSVSSGPEEGLMVGWVDETGKGVRLGRWSQGGELVEKAETIIGEDGGIKGPSQLSWWLSVAPGVLLIMAVLFRGVSLPGELAVPANVVQAAFWRRGAAFLIDFMPVVMLGSLIWQDHFMELARIIQTESSFEVLSRDPQMLVISLIMHGIFAAYCIVTEGFFGWTLGKRIMGLEVRQVKEMSARASWKQVIIRNVVKMLELNYFPMLLVVFLTRYRQRVGDMMAGTVVLQSAEKREV